MKKQQLETTLSFRFEFPSFAARQNSTGPDSCHVVDDSAVSGRSCNIIKSTEYSRSRIYQVISMAFISVIECNSSMHHTNRGQIVIASNKAAITGYVFFTDKGHCI